jgi:hypothetical protein
MGIENETRVREKRVFPLRDKRQERPQLRSRIQAGTLALSFQRPTGVRIGLAGSMTSRYKFNDTRKKPGFSLWSKTLPDMAAGSLRMPPSQVHSCSVPWRALATCWNGNALMVDQGCLIRADLTFTGSSHGTIGHE